MKNLKFKIFNRVLAIMLSLFTFISCNDDDNTLSTVAPTITGVSTALEDEPVTQGYADNMYIIRGNGFSTTQKIYFNDFDTYFNTTLVTDDVIIVKINRNTPYADVTNELKIVTNNGEAAYTFVVAPPAPALNGFNPVNAADGDFITIKGSYFLDPIVTFGDTEATIISNTLTEIQVEVPAGSNHKYITVTTISGDSSSTYALGTAIYDDVWYNGWDVESWNNHTYETDGTAHQGETYFKKNMGGWDNLQGNWAWDDQISAYGGIRMALKGEDGSKLKLVFNGNWSDDTAPVIELTSEWVEYTFSWADLLNADHVQNISFQEFTGNGGVYYFDNFGFYLNE